MPMWLARVVVVLIHIAGWGAMIAMGIYLKGVIPEWFEAHGAWTVFGVLAAAVVVIGLGTNLIQIRMEKSKHDR